MKLIVNKLDNKEPKHLATYKNVVFAPQKDDNIVINDTTYHVNNVAYNYDDYTITLSVRKVDKLDLDKLQIMLDEVLEKETRESLNEFLNKNLNTNGHEYVDLGLPSGTLWATCNVGAIKPEYPGLYFAWGETDPKEVYNWQTYKFNNTTHNLSKYNHTDRLETLLPEDDAATVNMGGDWHMPTKGQCEELTANTTIIWTTMNGANGRLFTSKTNGKTLFVPAAGCCFDDSVSNKDSGVCVWSSSLTVEYPNSAWILYFNSSSMSVYNGARCLGRSVRGVLG